MRIVRLHRRLPSSRQSPPLTSRSPLSKLLHQREARAYPEHSRADSRRHFFGGTPPTGFLSAEHQPDCRRRSRPCRDRDIHRLHRRHQRAPARPRPLAFYRQPRFRFPWFHVDIPHNNAEHPIRHDTYRQTHDHRSWTNDDTIDESNHSSSDSENAVSHGRKRRRDRRGRDSGRDRLQLAAHAPAPASTAAPSAPVASAPTPAQPATSSTLNCRKQHAMRPRAITRSLT